METRGSLVTEVAVALSGAGFQEPRRHARRLVASALAISRADLFGHPDLAVVDVLDAQLPAEYFRAQLDLPSAGHEARPVPDRRRGGDVRSQVRALGFH